MSVETDRRAIRAELPRLVGVAAADDVHRAAAAVGSTTRVINRKGCSAMKTEAMRSFGEWGGWRRWPVVNPRRALFQK
jgi:hypothetical protein